MNQEKIGKFIAECRKKKKITQAELASKLGVSEKSISNWENGRNMPDLSLFKPLCQELDITINELMSGEKIKRENYQEKFEENIINTINYRNKKIKERNMVVAIILVAFGLITTLSAMTIFESESSWGSIYSILGVIISLVGISRLIYKLPSIYRVLINFAYFFIFTNLLLFIDYISVVNLNQPPRFSIIKTTINNMIIYETPFYNLYRINFDTDNEYYVLDKNKEYNKDTVPNIPFDRDSSGIDNLLQYKSKEYNHEQLINFISSLPLTEKMESFIPNIDGNNLEINYSFDKYRIIDQTYFKQSIVYNSVSIFLLLDYVDTIRYNFNEITYYVTRDTVENIFPNYNIIKTNKIINKDKFNEYVEKEILRDDLVNWWYKEFFITSNIKDADYLIIRRLEDKKITNKKILNELYDIIHRSKEIDGFVTADGTNTTLHFYKDDECILSLYIWLYNNDWGSVFGFDEKEYLIPGLDGNRIVELITK